MSNTPSEEQINEKQLADKIKVVERMLVAITIMF
jgi:hypothetical protein